MSRAVASDGSRVHVGAANGFVYAVDLRDHTVVWTAKSEGTGFSTGAVRDGTVYQVSGTDNEAGVLVALDAATGHERWRFVAPDGIGLRAPSVDEASVYVGGVSGPIFAFDRATGDPRWERAEARSSEGPITLVGDVAMYADDDGHVYALDRASGAVRWAVQTGRVDGGIAVTDGRLVLGTGDGRIVALGAVDAASRPSAVPPPESETTRGRELVPVAELTAPGRLDTPVDVAVAPDGTIWVTEGGAGRFAIFAADGSFLERWGRPGAGDGEFDFAIDGSVDPSGTIAWADDGSFYVTDPGNFRVQHSILAPLDREPRRGVRPGRWAVPGPDDARIDGRWPGPRPGRRPERPAALRRRWGLPRRQRETRRATRQARLPGRPSGRRRPRVRPGLDRGPADEDADHRVRRLRDRGPRHRGSGARQSVRGQISGPTGCCMGPTGTGRIHVIDPTTGKLVSSWTVGPPYPASTVQGLGVAADGRIFAAEWTFDRVEVFRIPTS